MGFSIDYDFSNVTKTLNNLTNGIDDVAKSALYVGAGMTADVLNAAIDNIKTAPFQHNKKRFNHNGYVVFPDKSSNRLRLPTPEELNAIKNSSGFGIANFRKKDGYFQTKVHISGYTEVAGRRVATKELARSINSGTSFMRKQPVFRNARNRNKDAISASMMNTAQDELKKLIEES